MSVAIPASPCPSLSRSMPQELAVGSPAKSVSYRVEVYSPALRQHTDFFHRIEDLPFKNSSRNFELKLSQ